MRRTALALAALALPAMIAGTAWSQGAPPPLAVTVSPPLAKRVTQWDEYSGRFEAVNTVEVRPRVSGFIDQIHFKDGQVVKKGDLLFTIDQRQFQIALESARAEIARTDAQVALGINEVERATPLVKTGAVTERDLDQRQSNLAVARASLQAAQANEKSAALNLEWTEVRAPIDGRISDRRVDVGNLVTGGDTGTTLLTNIVSLDPIHCVFDVSESDYLRYARLFLSGSRPSSREASNPVRIKLADEDKFTHDGKMDFVDNQLNARSGTLRGRAIVDNGNQLLTPGVFARIQLFGGEIDAFLVPDSAIVSDQARKIVFVVDDKDTVAAKPVELGPIYEGLRIVKTGLAANDRVVIQGLANPAVRPGAKVQPTAGEIKTAAAN